MKRLLLILLIFFTGFFANAQWTLNAPTLYATDPSYNVGIGVNTPWSKLDVRAGGAAANDQSALSVMNPSAAAFGAVQIALGNGNASGTSGTNSLIYAQRNGTTRGSSLYFFNTDASANLVPRMTITDAGNVGVGTTVPQSMLHIVQNNNLVSLVLEGNSAGWGSGIYFKNTAATGGNYGIYSSSWGTLSITDATAGGDRIYIGANGNVGINTHNIDDPNNMFFVEGEIRSRKVTVDQAAWPDYVFDSTYKLTPLGSVERFIRSNHHLPELVSAESVSENSFQNT
jgi:hypothetical protein